MTKQVRWVCPECGASKLAPTRPRKDDVRRYCLPCSEKSGRLVPRLAPALEKQRAAKREKANARAATRDAKRRAAARAKTHLRLFDAAGRYVEIEPVAAARELYKRAGWDRAARTELTWNRRRDGGVTGRANEYRIHLSIGVTDLEDFVMLALHEGAHAEAGGREGHGPRWTKTYMAGAKQVLGTHVWVNGVNHRYDDTDPRVRQSAVDLSRKRRSPIVGRKLPAAEGERVKRKARERRLREAIREGGYSVRVDGAGRAWHRYLDSAEARAAELGGEVVDIAAEAREQLAALESEQVAA